MQKYIYNILKIHKLLSSTVNKKRKLIVKTTKSHSKITKTLTKIKFGNNKFKTSMKLQQ